MDEQTFNKMVESSVGTLSFVKTVNNIAPDSNGNVNVPVGSVADLISYGTTIYPDQGGNIVLPNFALSVNGTAPDAQTGNIQLTIGTVKSVNEISPDGQGNVDLGELVYSVNETTPDQNGNVDLDIAGTVQDALDDGTITITNIVQDAIDDGSIDVGKVKTVDGISPDAQGDVDFGMTGNLWMKTDANGHIWTTNETPIALQAGDNGYLFATNGVLSFKDE